MSTLLFVKNRYYSDYGLDYAAQRLKVELKKLGVELADVAAPLFGYGLDLPIAAKTVIFWDKDVRLAAFLENNGIKLLPNSATALKNCDDKELCYSVLANCDAKLVKTIVAPLVFDVNSPYDLALFEHIEAKLGYPVVVKQNVGSQGKQVYLAKNRDELTQINQRLLHTPHVYQQFFGEYGSDIRVYVLAGEAIAAVRRTNTTDFKSNVAIGGHMSPLTLTDELRNLAVKIAGALDLSFGSVDFLHSKDGELAFVEANSNAYFRGIEQLGIDIAAPLAKYIESKISKIY